MGWEQRPELNWQEYSAYWQVIVPDHPVGPRSIPVEGWTYRVYRRESRGGYEVFSWTGDRDGNCEPGTGQLFATIEQAKDEADRQDGWSYFGPYWGIIDGFAVQLLSNIDGDRFVIIDERDHDMTGWEAEVLIDPGWAFDDADSAPKTPPGYQRRKFDRSDGWYCYDNGVFNHAGYGSPEYRYPWTALCDHREGLVRLVPPEG